MTSASARFIVSAKIRILRPLAGVVDGIGQRGDVDELRLDAGSLLDLRPDEAGGVLAHPSLPRGAEDDRNEERPCPAARTRAGRYKSLASWRA